VYRQLRYLLLLLQKAVIPHLTETPFLKSPTPTAIASASQKFFLSRFNFRGFRWMKTMIHTIKEINERKDILPNHTLGYQIFDSCYTISKAMESSLVFLTGQEEFKPNFRNSTGSTLAALVGSGGSSLSVAASRILGLYYMPQVCQNIMLSNYL
jgi:hypothetical protein